MTTLQQAVDAAVAWVPKSVSNDWSVFEPLEGESDHNVAIREASKLLALRIDRRAPDDMIECQAKRLADMINPPAPPAFSHEVIPTSPSLGTQIAVGAAVGLAVAAVGRSSIGKTIMHQAVRSAVHGGFRELLR